MEDLKGKFAKNFSNLTGVNGDDFIGSCISLVYQVVNDSMDSLESFMLENFGSKEFAGDSTYQIYDFINKKIKKKFDSFEDEVKMNVFSVKKLDTDKYSIDSMVEELNKLRRENCIKELLVEAYKRTNEAMKKELSSERREIDEYIEQVNTLDELINTYIEFNMEFKQDFPSFMSSVLGPLSKYNIKRLLKEEGEDTEQEFVVPFDENGTSLDAFDISPITENSGHALVDLANCYGVEI